MIIVENFLVSFVDPWASGAKIIVLEQNKFFNQAGSSCDLARMFRTMYTEDYIADLAKDAMALWEDLERGSGTSLRWMNGILNFGDKNYGGDTPEGTLTGPIPNLDRLGMAYQMCTLSVQKPRLSLDRSLRARQRHHQRSASAEDVVRISEGLWRATVKQHTQVQVVKPSHQSHYARDVHTVRHETEAVVFKAKKTIIAFGAYVNHVVQPSFDISLDLNTWEMVFSYFNCNAGPKGIIFPSMLFQFTPDKNGRSQLFYGFPTLSWGLPNLARIAVDAATRRIKDPKDRLANVVNPQDVADTQEFIRNHLVDVDATVPALTSSGLQTNVFDNMFILNFVPEEYLNGGSKDSEVVFTAGWATKFVPMLGKALANMALKGSSPYALSYFAITRTDPVTGKGIIIEDGVETAYGSSCAGLHTTNHKRK